MKRNRFGTLFTKKRGQLALFAVAALFPVAAFCKGSIISSPHNLSAGAAALGGVAFSEEERICIFCHTPHNAISEIPLWSHELSIADYTPYDSSTLHDKPGPGWAPSGASRLCLSCHDGTVAIGKFVGSSITTARFMTGRANLRHDLSDDHPISFSYLDAFAAAAELAPIPSLPASIKLQWEDYMQCTSCHDPHDNENGNFLVINNGDPAKPGYVPGSPLCVTCHKNSGWEFSTHNPSLTPGLPNGCMNCHTVHAAPGPVRLLTAPKESDTCYATCHNGTVSRGADVATVFRKTYRHPVELPFKPPHDEGEEKTQLPAANYHVECVDCHNPHQANNNNVPVSLSSPPLITGRLKGVTGINPNTRAIVVAKAEYEVCFRCHSGTNADKFLSINKPNRMIGNPDQIGRFDLYNTTSFHPVTFKIPGAKGASLIDDMKSMQMIYCSDCHNSDQSVKAGGVGPNGPHGSRYEHILIASYDMPRPSSVTPPYSDAQYSSSYDLCFRCHSDTYITGPLSGFRNSATNTNTNEHETHVKDRSIPCFACHDPHGVPGVKTGVSSHLVNFDSAYAADTAVKTPVYLATFSGGSCTVKCHSNSSHPSPTRVYIR